MLASALKPLPDESKHQEAYPEGICVKDDGAKRKAQQVQTASSRTASDTNSASRSSQIWEGLLAGLNLCMNGTGLELCASIKRLVAEKNCA